MIRTYLSNDYIKRTIRPLYAWTQATPKPCFLDPNWTRSVPIWPGMGFVRTGGDLVTLAGANAAQMNSAYTMWGAAGTSSNGSYNNTTGPVYYGSPPIYGLGALYVGGDGIDELLYAGINAFAVWVLGPDAEFEILAPAFDPTSTWTDPPPASFGGSSVYGSGAGLIGVALQNASGANDTTHLGTGTLQGQLVPWAASTSVSAPVARLLKVNSSTKLTIGGLAPYDINQIVGGTLQTSGAVGVN
jgi:hypothetical protein